MMRETRSKREYPRFYEKMVPIAIGLLLVVIVAVLAFAFAVGIGVLSFG